MLKITKRYGTSTWRKSTLVGNRHLILDVSVVVDLWLKQRSYQKTRRLFILAEEGRVKLWMVASSIPMLDYVSRQALKRKRISLEETAKIVPELMRNLLGKVDLLSNYGYEQADIYRESTDYEDAQISASARSLAGELVCIVTENTDFDTIQERPAKLPEDVLAWLAETSENQATEKTEIPFINLAAQQSMIRPQIEQGMEQVLRHGCYIMGPEISELEERLQQYTESKYCITVASGTDALLISLMALNIGPGDEVITTPFTFIATAEVIVNVGAIPIFVDIEPDTCNIDVTKIEAAITPNTKAIIPVSLYGQPSDMDEINDIATKYGNIPVIEDAAQSFGSTYKGKKSCNLSTIGCTSFFPSKPLGCYGDGGAIFTDDENIAKVCKEIRVHGQSRRYLHTRIGVGGRMDTLQAAIILAKLDNFNWEVEKRKKIAEQYTQLISENCEQTTLPQVATDRTSVYAQYTIQTTKREKLQTALIDAKIPTAVHYPIPLNEQPAYKQYNNQVTPVAQKAAKQVISLPMHPYIKQNEIEKIVKVMMAL
jgi:UDP-2-acetamido-2-deoxy-ribo-hexuluronate aminotransferase